MNEEKIIPFNRPTSLNKPNKIRERKKKQQVDEDQEISTQTRNEIVVKYMPMIKCIARKISARLPSHIDFDDLVSNGAIGLMDAIGKYDSSRENKFRTYAEFRIRGSILDALRSDDWIPRSIRDKAKKINKAVKSLELKLGRDPEEREVADHMNISLEEFQNMTNETRPVNVLSIDEISFFNKIDKESSLKILETKESLTSEINSKSIRRLIQKAIGELPERQRMVLSLYYYEGFNLKKIGEILKVTESRVSQLHAQAVRRLKIKLSSRVTNQDLKAA